MPNESWRVPDMDANTGKFVPEEHGLIPQGSYPCRVVAFDDIRPSKTRDGFAYIRVELCVVSGDEFDGRKLFTHVYGLYDAVRMIMYARDSYLGQIVTTKVRITKHLDRCYNQADVIWPYPEGAKDEFSDTPT